jgi:hypothetical protein
MDKANRFFDEAKELNPLLADLYMKRLQKYDEII